MLEVLTPDALAAGLGATTFTPPRSIDDPSIAALAQTFAHNDGIAVVHDTIQYLIERSEHEEEWLEALSRSPIPTTLTWGLRDTVSPPRVPRPSIPEHLSLHQGRLESELWCLPNANHYLQHDDPQGFGPRRRACSYRAALPEAPGALLRRTRSTDTR